MTPPSLADKYRPMRKAQPDASFRKAGLAARPLAADVPQLNLFHLEDWPKFDQLPPKLSANISA
jgi:hypothetical protein